MTTATDTMSIGEVSDLIGLTTHTLRFYEQEGLFFAPVRRNSAGRRVFTRDEVEWLRVCTRLRSSGMPLPEIRRYAELVKAGRGNETERLDLLRQHEAEVERQIAELTDALGVIRHKVEMYTKAVDAGAGDELWRRGLVCD